MALYTTSLEVVVNNLCKDRSQPLDKRIASARPLIFNFDYPVPKAIWSEGFKEYFETAFINKYLFMEFGQETVAKWKQRVYARLLEVMPKYCAIFTILNNIDYNNILNDKNYTESDDFKNETKGKAGSKSAGSSLPENMLSKGSIGSFSNVGYADTSTISRSDTEAESTNTGTKKISGRTISQMAAFGEIGPDFNNYFSQLLDEFKDLFMVLYF